MLDRKHLDVDKSMTVNETCCISALIVLVENSYISASAYLSKAILLNNSDN